MGAKRIVFQELTTNQSFNKTASAQRICLVFKKVYNKTYFLWNYPNRSAAGQNVRRALTGKWSEMYFLPRTGESMVLKILQEVNPE